MQPKLNRKSERLREGLMQVRSSRVALNPREDHARRMK